MGVGGVDVGAGFVLAGLGAVVYGFDDFGFDGGDLMVRIASWWCNNERWIDLTRLRFFKKDSPSTNNTYCTIISYSKIVLSSP